MRRTAVAALSSPQPPPLRGGGVDRSESAPAEVPECVACGACCFSELPEYVRVFGIDLDRMDERATAFVEFLGNRCYMRMGDGRCTALVIDPASRRLTCSIYQMRPDVCRSLDRGSSSCRAELHAKADRALLAVERLVRAPS